MRRLKPDQSWSRERPVGSEQRTTLLKAALGRRSAARVQASGLRRGTGETIRVVLLSADLRDFTALSEATEPAVNLVSRLEGLCRPLAGRC